MESGIYIYCNLINGKKYVGQSGKIAIRLGVHLRESKNKNPRLLVETAIKKYKMENFYVIKIQYLKEQLNEMETYFVKFFNTLAPNGYNLTTGGNSNFKKSEEFEKNIRGKNNPFYGKKHSEETKKKIRENAKNNPNYGMKGKYGPNNGKKFSNEHKRKMSESQKKRRELEKMKCH